MIPAYALYRRSTAQQDLSIEEQREAVRAWASQHEYEIVREFADDASGLDTARRRDFLTLLHLCTQSHLRKADVVLCYDISRFSRLDPEEAAFHEYSLRRAGVSVIYTHDPGTNDGGVAGHLVKSLKRVLAHEFSQKLSQLVRRGQRAHAALGHWTGGRPPYGYRRAIRRQPDGTASILEPGRWKARGELVVLVPDPIEAVIVREIFEAYANQGLGVRAIAQRLNARGVPAPSSLRRRGTAAWQKTTVWHILRSELYTGRLVFGKARYRDVGKKRGKQRLPDAERVIVEQAVSPIVSTELWSIAQRAHGTRRFGTGRPWHRPYLLSGLIECAHCGKRFQAQRQSRGRIPAYYLCGGYVPSGADFCDSPRIPATYLDDAALDGVRKGLARIVHREEMKRRLAAALVDDEPPPNLVLELDRQLGDSERRLARLVEAIADGAAGELWSVRARITELERERARLERELSAARRRSTPRSQRASEIAEAIVQSLSGAQLVLESGDTEGRKALVRSFLQGVWVDKSRRRAVLRWYRLPQVDSFVKLVAVGGIEPPTRGL